MFSKRLHQLMEEQGLTLSQLAKETGIAKSCLHGYLNKAEPSLKNVNVLAQFFGISVDYLVWGRKSSPLEEVFKIGVHQGTYEVSIKRIIKKGEIEP